MADPLRREAISILKDNDSKRWSEFRKTNSEFRDLTGLDEGGFDLERFDLSFMDLSGSDFDDCTSLKDCNLARANLSDCFLFQARFLSCTLHGTQLVDSELMYASFERCGLSEADFSRSLLHGAAINDCTCHETVLAETDLTNADITGSTLEKIVLRSTNLNGIKAGPRHNSILDKSDTLQILWPDNWVNWAKIRALSSLPLFAVSWSVLSIVLFLIILIGYANEHLIEIVHASTSTLQAPQIPTPDRLKLLLVGSLLLTVGTTIYRTRCPERVARFTEAEWVDQVGHCRLMYIDHCLRRRWSMLATVLFSVPGGAITLWLLIDRIYTALRYLQ